MKTQNLTHKKDSKKQISLKKTSHHDIFFKFCYSQIKFARELFKMGFSAEEWNAFDWSRLRIEKDSFESLRADLVFSVPFKDDPSCQTRLCLLLEHKSQFSPKAYSQIHSYESLMIAKGLDEPKLWGPVLSVLFYHGKEPWKWSKSLKEGLWGNIVKKLPLTLAQDVVDSNIRVIDANSLEVEEAIEDESFSIRGILTLFREILSLKDCKGRVLEDRLKKILILFANWPGDREELALHLGYYLWSALPNMTEEIWRAIERFAIDKGIFTKGGFMNIRDIFRQEGREEGWEQGMQQGMQQGVQKGIQQGMQQGMQKGVQKGMQQAVLNMLEERADIDLIRKVSGFSEKEIKKLQNGG